MVTPALNEKWSKTFYFLSALFRGNVEEARAHMADIQHCIKETAAGERHVTHAHKCDGVRTPHSENQVLHQTWSKFWWWGLRWLVTPISALSHKWGEYLWITITLGAFACSRPKFWEKFRSREHSVAVRNRCWGQDGLWSYQSCPLPT